MKRLIGPKTTVMAAVLAGLLCLAMVQAKKPDKPGGDGGKGESPYTLVDLKGLDISDRAGYFQSNAYSVNEPDCNGAVQIVGRSYAHAWTINPVLWDVQKDGSFKTTDLGLPPFSVEAAATDINDWGMITITTDQGQQRPAWISIPGLPLQQLPYEGQSAQARAVNNFGDVVGIHLNISGALWELDDQGAPLYPIDLGDDFGGFIPSDINDSGVMVGYMYPLPVIAWLDSAGVLNIEFLETGRSRHSGAATAISPNGDWVVGWVIEGGTTQAFRWSESTGLTLLGLLGGDMSKALAVNDSGQVVGWSYTDDPRHPVTAFLYQDGQMLDLNSVARTSAKVQLEEATAINNAGHIVGSMTVTSGGSDQLHAFVLIPK